MERTELYDRESLKRRYMGVEDVKGSAIMNGNVLWRGDERHINVGGIHS